MKKYSLYILFLMGLGAMAGSCTNLDEKIYDRLVDNNFYKNEKRYHCCHYTGIYGL